MTLATCIKCQNDVCTCGEAYKHLTFEQLLSLSQKLDQMAEEKAPAAGYERTGPDLSRSSINLYMRHMRGQEEINSEMYFGAPHPSGRNEAAALECEQALRYDMFVLGITGIWASFKGPITSVHEHELEDGHRYKVLEIETQHGLRRYAVGAVDRKAWPELDGKKHINSRVLDLRFEVTDEQRVGLASHLHSLGHRNVHRKLALVLGYLKEGGLSSGLNLGQPGIGFGHEGFSRNSRLAMLLDPSKVWGTRTGRIMPDRSQGDRDPTSCEVPAGGDSVVDLPCAELDLDLDKPEHDGSPVNDPVGQEPLTFTGERLVSTIHRGMMAGHIQEISLHGTGRVRETTGLERRSLGDLGRLTMRPDHPEFTASDFMKYRRLSPGAKFQFLEGAGPDYTGEWVVTGFALYDEDKGPKLQVASIVGTRDGVSVSFYTSFSSEQVDETMVPFVSMEHIKILPDSWDAVEEPSFSDFKALKVGKTMGIYHLPDGLKFDIMEVEYRQRNYGLADPSRYIIIVKVRTPEEPVTFTFYSGNLGAENPLFIPGVRKYVALASIVFHD